MPKIRDSDSGNNKDKSGDNTSATNYSFRFNSFITFIYTLSISFLTSFLTSFFIKLSNLIIRVSDVSTTSLISLNSRIKIRNSFSLSFCRFTKCVIINTVIVIINSAA